MRRKKIEGILCLTGMLLLTGCGTKAYDLTEAEESQIVNYAVHVVSKHNSYQKDGLVYGIRAWKKQSRKRLSQAVRVWMAQK